MDQFYYYNKNDWRIQERSEGVGKDSGFQSALRAAVDSAVRLCQQDRSAFRYQLSEVCGKPVFFRGSASEYDGGNRPNVMIHALTTDQQLAGYFLQAPEAVLLWDGFRKELPNGSATALGRIETNLYTKYECTDDIAPLVRAAYALLLADGEKKLVIAYSTKEDPETFARRILKAMSAVLHYIPLEWRTAVTFTVPGTVDDPVRIVFMQGEIPAGYQDYWVLPEKKDSNLPKLKDKWMAERVDQNLEKWLRDPRFDNLMPKERKKTFRDHLDWIMSPLQTQTVSSDLVQSLKAARNSASADVTQKAIPNKPADESSRNARSVSLPPKKTAPPPRKGDAQKQASEKPNQSAQEERTTQVQEEPSTPKMVQADVPERTVAAGAEYTPAPFAADILMAAYCIEMAVLAFLGIGLSVWMAAWVCYIVVALGYGLITRQTVSYRDSVFDGFFLCTALAICGYSVSGRYLNMGSTVFCVAAICGAVVILFYSMIKRRGER